MTAFLTTTIHTNGAKNFMKLYLIFKHAFHFLRDIFSKFDFRLKTEEYKFLEIVCMRQKKIIRRLHTPLVCSRVALGFEKCMSDWLTLYHGKSYA